MATAANTNRTRRRPRSPEAELSDLPRGHWRIVIEDPRGAWRIAKEAS